MKINNIVLKFATITILIICGFSGYSQMDKLSFYNLRTDTIKVGFLDNFNYDVALVYANGIEVYNGILYSKPETGTTYSGFDIFYTVKEIYIEVVIFERNQNYSLEYNPLWYDWDEKNDPAFYYPAVKTSKIIKPIEDGRFVFISLEKKDYNNDVIRKYPVISTSKKPIILD